MGEIIVSINISDTKWRHYYENELDINNNIIRKVGLSTSYKFLFDLLEVFEDCQIYRIDLI